MLRNKSYTMHIHIILKIEVRMPVRTWLSPPTATRSSLNIIPIDLSREETEDRYLQTKNVKTWKCEKKRRYNEIGQECMSEVVFGGRNNTSEIKNEIKCEHN